MTTTRDKANRHLLHQYRGQLQPSNSHAVNFAVKGAGLFSPSDHVWLLINQGYDQVGKAAHQLSESV